MSPLLVRLRALLLHMIAVIGSRRRRAGGPSPTPPSVTSVAVSYNGQAAPILARTGSTYQLVAKDQSGNTLSGGTWSSSDNTNAPINSAGLASPAAGSAGTGITWTYTDLASGHSGTLTATVLKAATDLITDIATNYANDTALMANIFSGVPVNGSFNSNTPTGTLGVAKYGDGNYCNQIQIDPTTLFMGNKTFRVTITSNIGPTLRANVNGGTGYSRLFAYTVNRFAPGFTMVGTGGGASAYKITPWLTWGGSGRCGPEGTNGTTNTGTGGAPGGTFDLGVGDGVSGQSTQTTYTITSEFDPTNPQYWLDIVLYETRSGNIISTRHWHTTVGTSVGSALNNGGALPYGIVEGPMASGVSPFLASIIAPYGENYNQTAPVNIWRNVGLWGVVDGTSVGDPLGIFGPQPTPTLTSLTGGTVAHGTTNNTITLTGTNFTENCYPVFSNAGILAQSITFTSSTTITCVVNVSAGASTGVGTVLVTNGASLATTATQPVTVT